MASKLNVRFYIGLIVVVLLIVSPVAFAQFTANIQGVVQDPSGAGLAGAKVDLVNTATHVTRLRPLTVLETTGSAVSRPGLTVLRPRHQDSPSPKSM